MNDTRALLDRIADALGVRRRTLLVVIAALLFCLTAPLAVQGVVVRYAVRTASSAKAAAKDAKSTAEVADAFSNPNCDARRPACQRANAQRNGQGSVVPDLEEVSVIASYCGHVPDNYTLAEVRSCVQTEFLRLRGRPPQLQPSATTTTEPGG